MNVSDLYEEYETALLRYAQRLTHDTDWSEDLVQDTFLRALGYLDLLQMLKKHQRRAWLYRTLKNRFLDELATRRRQETLQQWLEDAQRDLTYDGGVRTTPNPFEEVPEQYRELFHMRYVLDMNSTEIAEILNISPATVRSRLHLVMKQLRHNRFKFE